jgi:hypothetical protein
MSCCAMQDCYRVMDEDLETENGHYRIRYKGEWITVPDYAVKHDEPNPTGFAVACVHENPKERRILCFVPASQV